jgi:hypothetical protein
MLIKLQNEYGSKKLNHHNATGSVQWFARLTNLVLRAMQKLGFFIKTE